ncbi:MAG: hypothetical protein RTU63_00025 [Candidatus Thorarchaeota archaeon]
MESESNSEELMIVRLLLLTPLFLVILWTFPILIDPLLIGESLWYIVLVVTASISFVLVVMILFAEIPSSTDNQRVDYFIEELEEQKKVFVIPTMCTQCKTPIQLDRVTWDDEYTPLCQECQGKIKLRIIEK